MAAGSRFTKEEKQEIIKLYNDGKSAVEISRLKDCGTTTVYRILSAVGIKPQQLIDAGRAVNRGKLTRQQRKEIAERYADGESIPLLEKEYDVGRDAILNAVRVNGGEVKHRGGIFKIFDEETELKIVDMYESGYSQEVIAQEFNTSQIKISRILRKRGICCIREGERHSNWKGGKISLEGYTYVLLKPDDEFYSMTNSQSYVAEHRLVMAEALGRPLHEWETVHHIDGNKKHNEISNLQLRIGKHGKHTCYRCAKCGSYDIIPTEIK